MNDSLKHQCSNYNFDFICNDNIKENLLNAGGLHLNLNGTITLAANFRKCINTD